MQVLTAALDLVADAVVLDLGALLQARLDGHLEYLVRLHALARLVKRLALNLHLLGDAVVELLERQGQRPLDRRNLGRRLALARVAKATRAHAGAAGTASAAAHEDAAQVVVVDAVAGAGGASLAYKLGKNVLGVVEVEAAGRGAAGAGAKVKGARAASAGTGTASAGHGAAKVKAGEAAGHAPGAGKGVAGGGGAGIGGRGGAASEQKLEAVLVVDFALLGVREDLVGLRALLELFRRVGAVLVLVGVPL